MEIPPRLIEQLARGRVVPFVGSGVSLAVKVDGKALFPSWGGLLADMAAELVAAGNEDDAAIVRSHCNKRRWLKAAEAALDGLNQRGFFDVLKRRFDIPQPPDADWSLPDAVWRLRPPIVLTTNYDDVLAWRNPRSRRLLNDQPEELAVLYREADPQRPFVWHLHGHISRAKSLILAPAQYEDFYGDAEQTLQQYRAATDQLRSLLANWTLLFVGFGLQDEYVMQLVGDVLKAFGGATGNHFALLKEGEGDAERRWKEHNVQVIPYADHGPPLVSKLDELTAASQRDRPDDEEQWWMSQMARRPVVPPAYAAWLANKCVQGVDLSGLRPKHGQAITLRHVYVPVVTRGGDLETEKGTRRPRPDARIVPGEDRPERQLLQALAAEESLYVSGPPGSGKTTFCRWLTLAVCQGDLPAHPLAPPKAFRETFPEPLRGRLPLLIRLREFWETLPPSAGGVELTSAELERVLQQWIARKKFDGLSWAVVKDHLDAGAALLIFDGVDEVPLTASDPRQPAQPRRLLLAGLADGVAHWTAAGNRVLVTSRPYGLSDQQRQRLGLPHAPLAELPRELQRLLVRRWFHCLRPVADEAEAACEELWADVAARPEIAELAANPLLLTAVCIVYGENGRLPQDEFDLFDRIVDTVLFSRYGEKSSSAADARSNLCVIAHGMHTGEELSEPRDQPRPNVTVDEIDRMLGHYEKQRTGREVHKVAARDTREDLLSKSGLLLPQADDRHAAFYHFTFQDFLTAERLFDLPSDKLIDVFRRRSEFSEWRKALDLLYGALLHKRSTPDQAERLLKELIGELTDERLQRGIVLADCWRVLRGRGKTLDADVQRRFVDFCVRAVQRETPLNERVELALALGRVGDPRVVDDLSDPAAWVEVEAGMYRVGDQKLAEEFEKEYSSRNRALGDETIRFEQPFRLSKYPVTNGLFARFVAAGGYDNRSLWHDNGWKWREQNEVREPELWRDVKWNGLTQPVVGVSWWEADAFCRWAGCRLPTEREWEAAARGPKGWAYPWGDDWREGICNSSEADLGVTTPVGIFPGSAAVCGAHDMAGNVWEWCGDTFDAARTDDPEAGRVLRGGSWTSIRATAGPRSASTSLPCSATTSSVFVRRELKTW